MTAAEFATSYAQQGASLQGRIDRGIAQQEAAEGDSPWDFIDGWPTPLNAWWFWVLVVFGPAPYRHLHDRGRRDGSCQCLALAPGPGGIGATDRFQGVDRKGGASGPRGGVEAAGVELGNDDVLEDIYEALTDGDELLGPAISANRDRDTLGMTATVVAGDAFSARRLAMRALGEVRVGLGLADAWMVGGGRMVTIS